MYKNTLKNIYNRRTLLHEVYGLRSGVVFIEWFPAAKYKRFFFRFVFCLRRQTKTHLKITGRTKDRKLEI